MTDIWEVKKGIGIGELRFGQNEVETVEIANIYGPALTRVDDEISTNAVIAQMEKDVVSMPILRPLIDQMRSQSKAKVTVGRGKMAPRLTFRQGKLSEIGIDWQCRQAHIGGIKLLPASLPDIAAVANQSALVNQNTVVFVDAGIALINFAHFDSDGSVDLLKYDNEERYVNLFPSGGYQGGLDGYTKYTFQ
jgi:hypothetical protein